MQSHNRRDKIAQFVTRFGFTLLSLILGIFSFHTVAKTLPPPEECERLLLSNEAFTRSQRSNAIWIEYGSAKLTVRANYTGDHQVILLQNDATYVITDAEQKRSLENFFYSRLAPRHSEPVTINYPRTGPALAYRVRKKDSIYTKSLKPDQNGVVQIPGLPPIYIHEINGEEYVDVPHPDVFNAYIGRNYFYPYTAKSHARFPGEITADEYALITSYDRFPIALADVDSSLFLHDVFGHALIMAVVNNHPIWKLTVEVAKRAFAVKNLIYRSKIPPIQAQGYLREADHILSELGIWETAANASIIDRARTQDDVTNTVDKLIATVRPILDQAQLRIESLEAAVAN
jgi:hypothetical protein